MRPAELRRLLLLLLAGAPIGVAAQDSTGSVEGTASSADDGRVVPFALIRLRPVQEGAAPQEGITGSGGQFRFARVPPGEYHLQLLRIGYRPVLSPLLQVRAGETLRHELRAPTHAVELAPVLVRADASCLGAAQLASEPRLAELWNEARKGVETRRAFELRYRFTRTVRQEIHTKWRFRKARRRVEVATVVNEPDSVLARDARLRARNRAEGYAEKGRLVVPNEKELLDEAFLSDHCLEASIAEADGALGLRFRPVRPRRDGVDVRGTIWVDAETYQMRRLELEHLRGNDAFGQVRVDYADVVIDGSALRLPSGGWGSARAGGVIGTLVTGATATLVYTYRDFEQVRSR